MSRERRRETDADLRAAARRVGRLDAAAVRLSGLAGDRESKAGARRSPGSSAR
jgi:hypothetical protein